MAELQQLQEYLQKHKGAWSRIAEQSGVSYRAIWNIAHGKTDARVSTVSRLCEHMHSALLPTSPPSAP